MAYSRDGILGSEMKELLLHKTTQMVLTNSTEPEWWNKIEFPLREFWELETGRRGQHPYLWGDAANRERALEMVCSLQVSSADRSRSENSWSCTLKMRALFCGFQ